MAKALYPGTFDPISLGHLDIATRASRIFNALVVGVYATPSKGLLFTAKERVGLVQKAVRHLPNVEVHPFHGLVVQFARTLEADVIVRGLRTGSDFEYEYEMAFMNKNLAPDIELVCLMTSLDYQFVSSSLLKEVAELGGDIESLVPSHVASVLHAKLSQRRRAAPEERRMSSTS